MLTPQDLQDVTFEKAKIGGYQMQSVDELLEPLMEDYVTLYKENAVLKSKMRLLVERLEEYRDNEAKIQAESEKARRQSEELVADARRRSEEILRKAEDEAKSRNEDVDSAVSAEQDRLAKSKAVTAEFVDAVEAQLERQRKSLELIRNLDLPKAKPVKRAYDYESEKDPPREEAAAEIAAQIEENVGRITNGYPSPDMSAATRVMPPIDLSRDTSAKFADLQFGKNYHN
jgi:cell division initiation protein